MIIADALCAFIMGGLSGMGIGGGGLLVIYLTLVKGTDQLSAQGLNLYFFVFASCAALFVHCRKRKINYPLALSLALFGMPCALFGSYLANLLHPELLKKAFGIMLIIAGGISLLRYLPVFNGRKKFKK